MRTSQYGDLVCDFHAERSHIVAFMWRILSCIIEHTHSPSWKRFLRLPLGCIRTPIPPIFDPAKIYWDKLGHRCLLLLSTASQPIVIPRGTSWVPRMKILPRLAWNNCHTHHWDILVRWLAGHVKYISIPQTSPRWHLSSFTIIYSSSNLRTHSGYGSLFLYLSLSGQHEDLSRKSFFLWCQWRGRFGRRNLYSTKRSW